MSVDETGRSGRAATRTAISPDAFRATLARQPNGVVVVALVSGGVRHAMTATSFTSVSLDPPLVAVFVGHAARIHPLLTAADPGRWAVSLLAADQQGLATRFARSGRDLLTQFDGVATTPGPDSGAPWLDGAAAWLDCRTVDRHEAGDHTIVIGEVVEVARAAGAPAVLSHAYGGYVATAPPPPT